MILVTFALPFEGRRFGKELRNGASVLYTGVGETRARRSLESWFVNAIDTPSLIIAAGFAGGLHSAIRRGDLVVDFRTSNPEEFRKKLRLGGIEPHYGKIYTSAGILDNPEFRGIVFRETGADAVDMETSAIREIAAEHHVPVVGLRVVTDSLDESLPVPPEVLLDRESGQPNLIRLGKYLARHPFKIPDIIRFGKECNKDAGRLAHALAVMLA